MAAERGRGRGRERERERERERGRGLSVAEGSGSLGGNRRARYANALGSARETRACLDVAAAMRCIHDPEPDVLRRLDHVIGTLVGLTR